MDCEFRFPEDADELGSGKIDIDSIAILSKTLKFYKCIGPQFKIYMAMKNARPMVNKKIITAVERLLNKDFVPKLKDDDVIDIEVARYLEIEFGDSGGHPLYICFRAPLAMQGIPFNNGIANITKQAVSKLAMSTKTRKKGASNAEPGTLSYCTIYSQDWPAFAENFHETMKLFDNVFTRNGIPTFYYTCNHGKVMTLGDANNFVNNNFELEELENVYLSQIHAAIVFEAAKGQAILNNCQRVREYYESNTVTTYKPFFLRDYGYFSNVWFPDKYKSVHFIQSYYTLGHIVKKDCVKNKTAIFVSSMLGQESTYLYKDKYISPGKQKIDCLDEYFNSIDHNGINIRYEFVFDMKSFSTSSDSSEKSKKNYFNADEITIFMKRFMADLTKNRMIVLCSNIDQHISNSIKDIFSYLKASLKVSPIHSSKVMKNLYHFENILNFWLQGTTYDIDYKNLMRYKKKTAENCMTAPFVTYSTFAIASSDLSDKEFYGMNNLSHGQVKFQLQTIYNFAVKQEKRDKAPSTDQPKMTAARRFLELYACYIAEKMLPSTQNSRSVTAEDVFSVTFHEKAKRFRFPHDIWQSHTVIDNLLEPITYIGTLILNHCVTSCAKTNFRNDLEREMCTYVKAFPIKFLATKNKADTYWIRIEYGTQRKAEDRGRLSSTFSKTRGFSQYKLKKENLSATIKSMDAYDDNCAKILDTIQLPNVHRNEEAVPVNDASIRNPLPGIHVSNKIIDPIVRLPICNFMTPVFADTDNEYEKKINTCTAHKYGNVDSLPEEVNSSVQVIGSHVSSETSSAISAPITGTAVDNSSDAVVIGNGQESKQKRAWTTKQYDSVINYITKNNNFKRHRNDEFFKDMKADSGFFQDCSVSDLRAILRKILREKEKGLRALCGNSIKTVRRVQRMKSNKRRRKKCKN